MKFVLSGVKVILLWACGISLVMNMHAEENSWKGAVAKVKITPTELGWMAGYAGRKGPAESVLQDLYAKAVAFEDGRGGRLVVVTLDLIGVPKPLRLDLEKMVKEKHDLKPEELLVNASHTHSGPAIRLWRPNGGKGNPRVGYDKIPEADQPMRVAQIEKYNAWMLAKIGEAIDTAMAGLEPVSLSMSSAKAGFAMNRRTPVNGGQSFKNSPNSDGPVDHEVPVLQMRDSENNLKAVLFGYACHATTMGTQEIHGDWPGFAQHFFEADHPGVTALFVNGCSGDQNPYPRRMQIYMERHGREAAMAIERALQASSTKIEGRLRSAIAWPEVRYDKPPGREELEKRIETLSGYSKRYAEFLLAELETVGSFPQSYPVPVQVVRFGNALTLVAIGGETTVDYSLRLKRELGAKDDSGSVWVAGYSNDVMTYIPSDRVLKEGGYEGGGAMQYARSTVHPNRWAPGIEGILVGKITELFVKLGE